MSLKKIAVGFTLPFLLTSLLCSQSVVELAKKEKDRRTRLRLQGKRGKVVTNADLTNLKRRPAIFTQALPFTSIVQQASPSYASSTRDRTIGRTSPQEGISPDRSEPVPDKKAGEGAPEKSVDELQERWDKANEYVTLLNTRIAGLWQEYYSMDDMSDRSNIIKQIQETNQKLIKAKEEETQAKRELDEGIRVTRKRKP